jgi:predicted nucleic acid-binding protein
MAVYFLDSSAIVKYYFQEHGHYWIEALHDIVHRGDELYISQAASVEVVATICRKARDQNMSAEERDTTIDDFRRDVRSVYNVRLVDDELYIAAGNLCRLHRLPAYDAIQLACAIAVRKRTLEVQDAEPPPFIFVSADTGLLNFARAEGLNVENPNHYS